MKRFTVALLACVLAYVLTFGVIAEGIDVAGAEHETVRAEAFEQEAGAAEGALWTEEMEQAEQAAEDARGEAVANEAIAIDSAHFPDDNFRDYVYRKCDTDGDGMLSEDERMAVTEMYVGYDHIIKLSGIEYFTNLSVLVCGYNDLVSLDISKNINLTKLDCASNELTKLDIVKNTALTDVNCSENALKSLDVSKSAALINLNCQKNKLTKLDVTKNRVLATLDCSNNKLTKLDIRRNKRLSKLYCGGNRLTAIDVTGCKDLKEFDCGSNKLKTLDVSNNKALEELYCGGNQIKRLDVTKNTKLTNMGCDSNNMKSLLLGSKKKLWGLGCILNNIDAIDISGCPIIKKLLDHTPTIEDEYNWIDWEYQEHNILQSDLNTKLYSGKKLLYRPGLPDSVSFAKKSMTLSVGTDIIVKLKMTPAGTTSECTFTSSNTSVADFHYERSNELRTWKKGTTILTVETSNGKKASMKVTVK